MRTFLASAYDESGNPLSKIQVYVGEPPTWGFPYPDGVTCYDGTARMECNDTVNTVTFWDPTGNYETITGPIVDANALNVVGVKMKRAQPGSMAFLSSSVLVSFTREDIKNILSGLAGGVALPKEQIDRLAIKLMKGLTA